MLQRNLLGLEFGNQDLRVLDCPMVWLGGVCDFQSRRTSSTNWSVMTNTRVNVGRMTLVLLVTLIMPLIIGVCLDLLLETFPWITVSMGVLSLPVSAFFVVRQGKYEMERVIEAVAPVSSPAALASDPTNPQQG